jgi:type IV pilus assembly protein PilE
MEMMIVVVIVGILATIAYPSYQEQVRKSRRSDAKQALMDAVNRQEQYILDHSTATRRTWTDLGYVRTLRPSEEGYYSIAAETDDCVAAGVRCRTYTLTATPVAAKPQAADEKCTEFSVTSTGVRTAEGSLGNECW